MLRNESKDTNMMSRISENRTGSHRRRRRPTTNYSSATSCTDRIEQSEHLIATVALNNSDDINKPSPNYNQHNHQRCLDQEQHQQQQNSSTYYKDNLYYDSSHLQLDLTHNVFDYRDDEHDDSLDSSYCCYCNNSNDYCCYCQQQHQQQQQQQQQRQRRQTEDINHFPRTELVDATSFLSTDDKSSCTTDRGVDNVNDCFLRPNRLLDHYYGANLQRFAIYENLCQRCGYGIGCNCAKFEKKSVAVSAASAAPASTSDLYITASGDSGDSIVGGNHRMGDNDNDNCLLVENIYENICDTCSFIYNGDKCQVCENQQQVPKKTVATAANKQLNKFAELLGNLRQRLRDKTTTTTTIAATPKVTPARRRNQNRRPEIVHNIDDVYKTNKTFDLNEIVRLKREEILASRANVAPEVNHVYGKLRCSDEHLVANRWPYSISNNSTPISTIKASASDSNFFEHFVPCDNSTFSLAKQTALENNFDALYENLPIRLIDTSDTSSISTIPYEQCTTSSSIDVHIHSLRNWMTSLRGQTYDYDDDTRYVACIVKCIPSKYVSCCEPTTGIAGMHEQHMSNDINDNQINTDNCGPLRFDDMEVWTRVDQFRANLIENQTKRTAAYFKQQQHKHGKRSYDVPADVVPLINASIMDGDDNAVASTSPVLSESETLSSMCENNDPNKVRSMANMAPVKVKPHKQANIGVAAAAVACNSLHSNAEIMHVSQCTANAKATTRQAHQPQQLNGQLNRRQYRRPSIDTFQNEAIRQHIITQLALSTGLNRSTLVYDKRLYTFLAALINDPYTIINYPNDMNDMVIIFNKAHDIQSSLTCPRSRTNINNIGICGSNRQTHTTSPAGPNEKVNLNDFDFILHPRCITNSATAVKRIDDFEKTQTELMACKKTVIEDFQRPSWDNDQMRSKKTVNDFEIRKKSKSVGSYSSAVTATAAKAKNRNSGGGCYKEEHEIKIRNHDGGPSIQKLMQTTAEAATAVALSGSADNLNPDESIYQSIWKFQTVGSARESDVSFISEYYTASEFCEEIVDVAEWEVAEEFSFATRRNSQLIDLNDAVSCSDDNVDEEPAASASIYDPYRAVCILYNENNSKYNKIIYDYNGNTVYGTAEEDGKNNDKMGTTKERKQENAEEVAAQANKEKIKMNEPERQMTTDFMLAKDDAITFNAKFIEDKEANVSRKDENYELRVGGSVVAWQQLIRSVAYMEDEEDMMLPESFLLENLVQSKNEKNSSPLEKALEGISPMVSSNESLSDGPVCKFSEKPADDATNRNPKILSTTPPPEVKSKRDLGFLNKLQYKRFDVSKTNKKEYGVQGLFYKNLDAKSISDAPNDLKKNKSNAVFGADLKDVEKDEKCPNIPKFVVECIKIIELEENVQTNGIYRASGKKESIDKLKKKMNESKLRKGTKYVALKDEDIHTVTGALKQFFRELKTDLIPIEIVKRLPDDFENAENLSKIRIEMDKIDLLPRECLKYLLQHLIFVDKNSEHNLMNASNLSIVWGACIFISSVTAADTIETSDLMKKNTLFKILIQRFHDIFPDAS